MHTGAAREDGTNLEEDDAMNDEEARITCQEIAKITISTVLRTSVQADLPPGLIFGYLLAGLSNGLASMLGVQQAAALLEDVAGTIRAHDPQASAAAMT